MGVRVEGETKCKGTKRMGQNQWDEVNVGRNDRVPKNEWMMELDRIFRFGCSILFIFICDHKDEL